MRCPVMYHTAICRTVQSRASHLVEKFSTTLPVNHAIPSRLVDEHSIDLTCNHNTLIIDGPLSTIGFPATRLQYASHERNEELHLLKICIEREAVEGKVNLLVEIRP